MKMKALSRPSDVKGITQDVDSESDFQSCIESLFCGVEHNIDFFPLKNSCMIVDVTYTDYLPVSSIKEVIRKMLPKSYRLSIHREYSPEIIALFLYREFCENNVGIVDCISGSLDACSIREFVNNRLDQLPIYPESASTLFSFDKVMKN